MNSCFIAEEYILNAQGQCLSGFMGMDVCN
jgi:hypothetical protein